MKYCKNWLLVFLTLVLASCNQEQQQSKITSTHPLKGETHYEVYDFIVDHVRKSIDLSREQAIENKKAKEAELQHLAGEVNKEPLHSVYHGQMADLLYVFCHHFPECRSLSLYAGNGQILEATSRSRNLKDIPDLIINDDLYQKYQQGTFAGPYADKKDSKTIYPIYIHPDPLDSRYGTHTRPAVGDKPIGYIVYKTK